MQNQQLADQMKVLADRFDKLVSEGSASVEECSEAAATCLLLLQQMFDEQPNYADEIELREIEKKLHRITRFSKGQVSNDGEDAVLYNRYCVIQTMDTVFKLAEYLKGNGQTG